MSNTILHTAAVVQN